MRRRDLLGRALAVVAGTSGLAGCSGSESTTGTTQPTGTASRTPDPAGTRTARGSETETRTPTPGTEATPRSLDPYRSWLVAPTPVSPDTYEFSYLSLAAVRADATRTFADRLDAYWDQRSADYFGVAVPVEDIESVLTVNHSETVNESYRVVGGSFDLSALRAKLDEGGFAAAGRVADFERFVGMQGGRTRVIGLHPDLLVTIGTDDPSADPLARAVEQHRTDRQRYRDDEGLARLLEYLGTDDFVTGRELVPEVDANFPLSGTVATGRRLDIQGSTSWVERAYVFTSDATVERSAFERAINRTHVGQPTTEFTRDGRVVAVAGEVANSLVRLL